MVVAAAHVALRSRREQVSRAPLPASVSQTPPQEDRQEAEPPQVVPVAGRVAAPGLG